MMISRVCSRRHFLQRDSRTSDRPEVLTLNAGDECALGCMAISADVFPLAASVVRELEASLSLDTKVVLANSGPQVFPRLDRPLFFVQLFLIN